MGKEYAKNAMISMFLAMAVHAVMNSLMGYEMPVHCTTNVNDFNWNTSYLSPGSYHPQTIQYNSTYITMKDGTRLAADYYMSSHVSERGDKLPTVIHLTRYGRAYYLDAPLSYFSKNGERMNPRTGELARRFGTHGYAFITIDVRGTGASYGTKTHDFSQQEVDDSNDIINWVISQRWSNGEVAAYVLGLEGLGAVAMASIGHPAFKALVINDSPVDLYNDAYFPGGVYNYKFVEMFTSFTMAMDRHLRWAGIPALKPKLMMYYLGGNPYPVDGDKAEMKKIAMEHASNYNLTDAIETVEFRDDLLKDSTTSFQEMDLVERLPAIAASGVAVYTFGGYFNMGAARSAVKLYKQLNQGDGKHRLTLGPWSHSGVENSDPHAQAKQKCFRHPDEMLRFFDYHMHPYRRPFTGLEEELPIHYFTMVKNEWRSSDVWPPSYITNKEFSIGQNRSLIDSNEGTVIENGHIETDIQQNFSSLNGLTSRWNGMNHIFTSKPSYYFDRSALSRTLLTFESKSLPAMEFTGEAELRLYISVNAPDVALFAYIEDMDYTISASRTETKRPGVTYITEAIVRPLHEAKEGERTYSREDANPLIPGEIRQVVFRFLPVSYFIKRKHQLRITISASEATDFALPSSSVKSTKLKTYYGPKYPSSLSLPQQEIQLNPLEGIDSITVPAPIIDESEDEFKDEL